MPRPTNGLTVGGDAADAFDVVVPSLPGYGFSTPLKHTGINFWNTADLWVELMQRLGYERFAAQGGDWGSFISAQLGHKYADRIIGVHIHTPAPLNFMEGQSAYDPDDFGAEDASLLARMARMSTEEMGYLNCRKPSHKHPRSPWWILPSACWPGSWRNAAAGVTATAIWHGGSVGTNCSTPSCSTG